MYHYIYKSINSRNLAYFPDIQMEISTSDHYNDFKNHECLENFWKCTGLKRYKPWFLNCCAKGVCAVAISCVCPLILDLCVVSTRAHIDLGG